MTKFQKRYFLENSQITKLILDTIVVFKTTFMMNQNLLVSMYSFNLFLKVMRIALITLHNTKKFLYNIRQVLILLQAKHRQNLRLYIWQTQDKHHLLHFTLKQTSVTDT